MWHRLPLDLRAAVLRDWLADLADASALDVAYCSHADRDAFLAALRNPEQHLELDTQLEGPLLTIYLHWLCTRAAQVPALRLDVSAMKPIADDALLIAFPAVRRLCVSKHKYMKSLEPTDFVDFFAKFPHVTALDCSPCSFNIKDELLIVLTNAVAYQRLPVLEVDVRACPNLSDQSVWNLATKLPTLRAFHARTSALTFVAWQSLLDACPQLEVVSMNISALAPDEVLRFCTLCPRLCGLALHEDEFEDHSYERATPTTRINANLLLSVAQARPLALERLEAFPQATGPDELAAFARILAANPQLRLLRIAPACYEIAPSPVVTGGTDAWRLTAAAAGEDPLLSLFNCVRPALAALEVLAPQTLPSWLLNVTAHRFGATLREARLGLGEDVRAAHLQAFFTACPRLQRLALDFRDAAVAQTDELELFAALSAACPQLSMLALRHCRVLTDDSLLRLVESLGRQLVALDVSHCPQVGGTLLSLLAQRARQLRRLDALGTRITLECLAGFQRRLDAQARRRPRRMSEVDTALGSKASSPR